MCTSKSEGGQRCASSTTKSLTTATARFENAYTRYQQAVTNEASPMSRVALRERAMKAYHAYEDALVEHATTDQGRTELEALRDAAPVYLRAGENASIRADYEDALTAGSFLRKRRAEIKEAVRRGEMTSEQAEHRGAYPNEFARDRRATEIAKAKDREEMTARPPVNLPAGVSADDGTRITKFYFSCEHHKKPGQCTQACADLESAMSGDLEAVTYDETGTTYGPPKPYTEYAYDPEQRASIAVVYSPL